MRTYRTLRQTAKQTPQTPQHPRLTLTLPPEPGNRQTPPVQRLRVALKVLLRGYGLRCTRCQPTPPASLYGEIGNVHNANNGPYKPGSKPRITYGRSRIALSSSPVQVIEDDTRNESGNQSTRWVSPMSHEPLLFLFAQSCSARFASLCRLVWHDRSLPIVQGGKRLSLVLL